MKIKYLIGLSFLVSVLFFQACSSGKKAYQRGDYITAVNKAVDRLRRNPDHKKSREVLKEAYPQALQYYNGRIRNIQASNQLFKNVKVLEIYKILNTLHEDIQRSPGAMQVIPNAQSYFNEVREYTPLAAEERYQAGVQALAGNNRQAGIEAYEHFMQAEQISRGYKDAAGKMEEALQMATLKVMVRQVSLPSVNYQLSIDFFQDQVYEFLFHYDENRFVRFMSENDFHEAAPPDQILEIMFDDFVVGQTNNFRDTKEYTKDSVVVATTKTREGEMKVYGTVKASFTENRREVISKGLLSMRVIDAYNNQVIMHDKFPGEFVWISRWGSFNGDERALSEEQIKITKLEPLPPPPPQQLFIEFCRPIYGQLQNKVRQYYRGV
ncbi:MAG: hypothetical protein ACOCXH_02595 [Cyclobacteriaceae bacterium]